MRTTWSANPLAGKHPSPIRHGAPVPAGRYRSGNERGFGLIELMATVAMAALVAAASVTSFDRRRMDLDLAVRQIVADVRWARARSILSGDHCQLRVTGDHTYQIEQLEEIDGAWQVKLVFKEATLPHHLALAAGDEARVEFNTRGVVDLANNAQIAPLVWTLTDVTHSGRRSITLYPSGQIHADS